MTLGGEEDGPKARVISFFLLGRKKKRKEKIFSDISIDISSKK